MMIKTQLVTYSFDLRKDEEKKPYKTLCRKLKRLGLVKFDCLATQSAMRTTYVSEEVTLETNFLFDNQWNEQDRSPTEKGRRLFDWYEPIFPNKTLRKGYYLVPTPEMQEVRDTTFKCGYCGKHYHDYNKDEHGEFCLACINSPYLREDNLPLLRLKAVSASKTKSPLLTEAELAFLKPLYIEAQTKLKDKNKDETLLKLKEQRDKAVNKAETEYAAMLWLVTHNISIENCIYYPHTGRFCFGWKTPLTKDVASELLDILVEFPFNYDLKEEKCT
jgi:hypothetical protein